MKVCDGYCAWPPSAAFGENDIQVQWTAYALRDDGLYVRTAQQSDQEALATSPIKVAMQVKIDESDNISGGKLSAESSAALLALGLVREDAARSVRGVEFIVPAKGRSATQPPPPFVFDSNRVITSVNGTSKFSGSPPAIGDVLMSIDGGHCEAANDARSELRASIAAEASITGGSILFRLWTPPSDWVAPSLLASAPTPADETMPLAEELPAYEEGEMKCLIRLCCRMIDGARTKKNREALCGALALHTGGSEVIMKRRIEFELRRRNFSVLQVKAKDRHGAERALPSHSELTSRTLDQVNESYNDTVFQLPQIVHLLRSLPTEPADAPNALPPEDHQKGSPPAVDSGGALNARQSKSFVDVQLSSMAVQSTVVVSFGECSPVECLHLTARTMGAAERKDHHFFRQISVAIGEQPYTFCRVRGLADDSCPVFEHDDGKVGLVRLRIYDISRDASGVAWLHGYPLYSKSQLPDSTATNLPDGFDSNLELAEGIDMYQVNAEQVRGVARVLSSSSHVSGGSDGAPSSAEICHHEAAFVEEMESGQWKVTKPKFRPEAGLGRRGTRAR